MSSTNAKMDYIKQSDSQDKIIDFALNDSDWHVRRFAVSYIDDENILKGIVANELNPNVAIKALEFIFDTDFLCDVCLNHPDSFLRFACVNQITDELTLCDDELATLLEKMLLNDPDELVLQSVCENQYLDNQKIIIKVAKSSKSENIKRILIRKITDEKVLLDFALHDKNPFIRREAILNPNLSDIKSISKVIEHDCDEFNRIMAINKIQNIQSLLDIIYEPALHHRLHEIAQNINFSLNDYFSDIFKNETDDYKRQVAVNFIEDGDFLDEIILNHINDEICADAIKNDNFTNQKILERLMSSQKAEILSQAVLKINNNELLLNYIKNHLENIEVIAKAISRMEDIDFLKELSDHFDSNIRFNAVRRISMLQNSENILREIALTQRDEKTCLEAIGHMNNKYHLADVAKKRKEKEIRIKALKQIKVGRLIDNYIGLIDADSTDGEVEHFLKDLALNDCDGDIRKIATGKIMDKEFLDEIASGGDVNRFEAQNRLKDLFEDIKRITHKRQLNILIQMSDNDVSSVAQASLDDLDLWETRLSKVNQIEDINTLKSIAKNDFNYWVRLEAEGKLEKILFRMRLDEVNSYSNQEKLKSIVCDDEFSLEIRRKALFKINDQIFVKKFENI